MRVCLSILGHTSFFAGHFQDSLPTATEFLIFKIIVGYRTCSDSSDCWRFAVQLGRERVTVILSSPQWHSVSMVLKVQDGTLTFHGVLVIPWCCDEILWQKRLKEQKVCSNSQLLVKTQGKGSQSDQTFKESDTFHLSSEVALQGSQQYPFSSVGFMVPWGPPILRNKWPPHKGLYLVAWYKQENPRGVKWWEEVIEMIRLYITI